MELKTGSSVGSANCTYKILQELSPGCYVASAVLHGKLGNLASDESFLLVSDADKIGSFNAKFGSAAVVERLSAGGRGIVVLRDCAEYRSILLQKSDQPVEKVLPGANRYRGELRGGLPHGKGTLYYGDGKVYCGEFVGGLRHGEGRLTMPNGEYFEGLFENDHITDKGTYFDENGRARNVAAGGASVGPTLWSKLWRLPASLLCFGIAWLTGWMLVSFFTSGHGGIMRIGAFVAPLVFGWWGLKLFVGFITHLFSSNIG